MYINTLILFYNTMLVLSSFTDIDVKLIKIMFFTFIYIIRKFFTYYSKLNNYYVQLKHKINVVLM